MVSLPITSPAPKKTVSSRHALLEDLIAIVTRHVNEQLLPLSARCAAALLDIADMAGDARAVHQRFKAGNLLKNNQYTFVQLAAATLERAVRREIAQLAPAPKLALSTPAQAMTLVPYEEMDKRVAFSALSRPFDVLHGEALATLNVRLGCLLERDILRGSQNPFRPEVLLTALQMAWLEFEPDADSAPLLLALFKPETFLELGPMLEALNLALMRKGVLPGSVDAYKGRKADTHDAAPKARQAAGQAALARQLRQLFSAAEDVPDNLDPPLPGLPPAAHDWRGEAPQRADAGPSGAAAAPAAPSSTGAPGNDAARPLLHYLSRLQQAVTSTQDQATQPGQTGTARPHNVIYLPKIKESAPKGSLTRSDETTIDLLSAVFDTVFQDKNISGDTRELMRFLQIPVLKAALVDQDFFFQETHPARRLIDVLSQMGWERGAQPGDDALFKAMQRSVERVGRDARQELSVFAEALAELETSIKEDEATLAGSISAPIATALKQEKMAQAGRSAQAAVALRIGGGEVLLMLETFLENKWVPVLTLAHTVEDERPGVVENATRTMDELIWSVKPKLNQEERKRLIAKLPALLASLNKWLDLIQWQDAERLQFFAELAECHASIVRAPLDLTPERQLEISIEIARQAAQRRLARQQQAAPAPEPEPADSAVDTVATMQRGMWVEFVASATAPDAEARKVKLAWVSPLRSLFIFSAGKRQMAFSMTSDELAGHFRSGQASLAGSDKVVARALGLAMAQAAVNDASIEAARGEA